MEFTVIIVIIIIMVLGVQLDKNTGTNMYQNQYKKGQVGKVTILWNQQVQTDRTIPINKPDIIIRDDERGTCVLIDVAISGDRNVI